MIALIKTLQVILALGILILVHEFGHFFFAKLFRIRVDKFFLFFDAGGFKLLSTKTGWFARLFPKATQWETEYGIGWLPLGGYCKIAGMIDESMDTEHLKTEPQPWEFRTKPAWQRLLVMAGGVLFNFIFAVMTYSTILGIWGEAYIKNDGNGIYVNELAYEMGFRNGDRILAFDDYIPEDFSMLQADLVRENTHRVTVLRQGDTLNIYIDQNMIGEVLQNPGMFSLAHPFIVSSVAENSLNKEADLQSGDRIIAIDSMRTEFVQDAWKILGEKKGGQVLATITRQADTLTRTMQVDTSGMLGVYLQSPEVQTREYTFLSAIPAGFTKTFSTIGGYLKDLKLVFTPKTEAYKSVGSFIAIGQIFPSAWDWHAFLSIIALLSIMLAVMNLLPIPALDGGHIVFTLYEMITGRKPDDRFLMVTQMIGMILILGLMFLAIGNDILRFF
ncbi:MAG: RIP metalloprotease RseP [Bacteroidales bacterium]|nr:RIP metalloprotease RseP [Bacteroidales bacterium]